jgi:hypothetical protein
LRSELLSISGEASRAHRAYEFEKLFGALSIEDLRTVARLLHELPRHCQKDATNVLVQRLVDLDPAGAAAFLQETGLLPSVAKMLLSAWTKRDPEAAVAWYARFVGPTEARGMIWVLHGVADKDPARAVNLLLSTAATFDPQVYDYWFAKWAAANPADAMTRAATLENTRHRRAAIQGVVRGWVENDPAGALAWLEQVNDPALRNDVAAGFAAGLYAKDPESSLALLRALPPGRDRDRASVAFATTVTTESWEAIWKLIEEVPFDPGQSELLAFYRKRIDAGRGGFESLLNRLGDPALAAEERAAVENFLLRDSYVQMAFWSPDAAKHLAELRDVPAGNARRTLLERATAEWARQALPEARAWAEALPPGDVRDRALAGVVQAWAASATDEVAAWLDQQPRSPTRDAAAGSFAKVILPRDPATALARLRTISDAELRLRALQESWQNWSKRDPAAAQNGRTNSPDLTASERNGLTNPP